MDLLRDISSNILATFVFWAGFGALILLWIRITQRRLLRFFGLESNRNMAVYLSNLWQPSTGTHQGQIIAGPEFQAVKVINNLFGEAPLRLPELVRGLVDSFWIGKKINLSIEVSPTSLNELAFSNMIVIGATPKNSVRRYYLGAELLFMKIQGEQVEPVEDVFAKVLESGVVILKGSRKSDVIPGDYHLAIIEKIIDEEHQTVVFFCTGFRGDCSWGAAEYLARNWNSLEKRYKNKAFALCLGFPIQEKHMESYVEPKILASLPHW